MVKVEINKVTFFVSKEIESNWQTCLDKNSIYFKTFKNVKNKNLVEKDWHFVLAQAEKVLTDVPVLEVFEEQQKV